MADIKSNKHKTRSHRNNSSRNKGICGIIMSYIQLFITFVRYYIDIMIDKIFGMAYDDKSREKIPNSSNKIVLQSASSLAAKIRKGELKSEEVVRAFIDRVKEVNPIINAVVDNRFRDAIEEAKKIDYNIMTGSILDSDFQEKPFLGVPFTVKESSAVKGLSNTYGVMKRKGRKATFDAECIELMKKAGAICIGVTNIPQLNYWQETSNPVYGLTRNPYNTTRNVGGSSGGEAAILAACGTSISIGTDIGGSVRIPAFMCGVFGHKPTSGLTSTKGLTFRTGDESETMVVVGSLARHAEDLAPVLRILADKNASKLKLSQPVNVSELKVCYVRDPKDPYVSSIRPEMKDAIQTTVNFFKDFCKQPPEEFEHAGLAYTSKLWRYWMTREEVNFKLDLNDRESEVNAMGAIAKHFMFMDNDHTTGTVYNLINSYFPKVEDKWAMDETEKLKKALLDKMGNNGVLIYPSAPFTARKHHTALLRPWNFNLFSIFNVLKFPVTQVPLGLDSEGLPYGMQVVSAPYNDHLCIAVAKQLESQFGGYVPPFKCE